MSISKFSVSETAAQYLVPHIPFAFADDSVGSTLSSLPENAFDSLDAVYIIDREGHLLGLVRLLDLLTAPREQQLSDIMTVDPPRAYLHEDQERVAGLAVKYGLTDVPVIDSQECLRGVVPARSLIAILRREHIEDLHRLAGIRREDAQTQHSLQASPTRRAQDRLPWLIVGLIGSILATFVVSRFEQILEARIFVAFFVPGIVYLADAIGTQTEAIVVRGLSLNQMSLRNWLSVELWTGLLIGVVLGGLSFPIVWGAFGDIRLAFAVALTIITAGGIAASIGLLFPWLLYRAGKDPAFGSGPVATIVQDVLSLLMYFTIVQLLLG
ncbi:magnesium transporter [Aerosakkonemataceae cyanobacterium BLCC-F154]|uniref:Magnesium transporter n=1 Tax=Floridaenema fluviatile BLCC-F154 TaxID=3153640 RepID=A0ABV4YJU5_9CYAN